MNREEILQHALGWLESEPWDECYDRINLPVPCNIVCTVTLDLERPGVPKSKLPRIDLRPPARYKRNAKRNESEFVALKVKYQSPSATTLTFPTYKMLCVGANTPAAGEYTLHRSVYELSPYCEWRCFRNFSLNNMVCHSRLDHWVDVGRMYAENQSEVRYDPISFPGCKYDTPPMVGAPRSRCVMIFEAGAFNVMGIVDLQELLPIVKHIIEFGGRYRTEARQSNESIVEAREEERIQHLSKAQNNAKRQKLDSVLYIEDM
jgi:TATA-box binding protein (TBP) (component of TFIID and TFIIIB)